MRIIVIISTILLIACGSIGDSGNHSASQGSATLSLPIADYVVSIFEDSKGNLWFGTVGSGVAMFNGKELTYFTINEGLADNTSTDFAEDSQGIIWIATHNGLSKYDGVSFKNYMLEGESADNRISELLIDRKGILWVGTWSGVFQFNGTEFNKIEIPYPDIEKYPHSVMHDWTTSLIEDNSGNIWIGRDGYGACKYDGLSFTHFTKLDGLSSNSVQEIYEDEFKNIWFGHRIAESDHPDPNQRAGDGGITLFGGSTFYKFMTEDGLNKHENYAIAKGSGNEVWFGANKRGVYKYVDGESTLFDKTDRTDLMPFGYGVQSILEDSRGNVWIGLSGGLFVIQSDSIIHVSKEQLELKFKY